MRDKIKDKIIDGIIIFLGCFGLALGYHYSLLSEGTSEFIIIDPNTSPSSEARVGKGLPESASGFFSFEDLLDAIEWVESKGNANAIGDNGKAVGSFQIHKIYVDDVNRIERLTHKDKYLSPLQWKYYNRKSPYCSRWMVKTYLEHYATRKCLGHKPTLEDMARIHNGGLDGWKKESTKPYWEKVKKRLEGAPN